MDGKDIYVELVVAQSKHLMHETTSTEPRQVPDTHTSHEAAPRNKVKSLRWVTCISHEEGGGIMSERSWLA